MKLHQAIENMAAERAHYEFMADNFRGKDEELYKYYEKDRERSTQLLEWLEELEELRDRKQRNGKWIVEVLIGSRCNKCGKQPYPYHTDSSEDDFWKPDYCPNCGAEMEGEEPG